MIYEITISAEVLERMLTQGAKAPKTEVIEGGLPKGSKLISATLIDDETVKFLFVNEKHHGKEILNPVIQTEHDTKFKSLK